MIQPPTENMPSNPIHDYYETLGVQRAANADEIRKSYRKLARKFHPDLNPGDKAAEDRFKNVQEAYDVLSEPKKRQMYDQVGFYSDSGMPNPGSGSSTGNGNAQAPPNMDFSGFDFSDYARQAGEQQSTQERGGFRDVFSQFFRGHGQEPEGQPEKGADLEYGVNIDFWQAIRGTQMRLEITRHEVCETCHGSGQGSGGSVTCPQCSGTGQVTQMAGAMKFNLTCPKCNGKGPLAQRVPHMPWGRANRSPGRRRHPDSGRRSKRITPARRRKGQRRDHGCASRGSLYNDPG